MIDPNEETIRMIIEHVAVLFVCINAASAGSVLIVNLFVGPRGLAF